MLDGSQMCMVAVTAQTPHACSMKLYKMVPVSKGAGEQGTWLLLSCCLPAQPGQSEAPAQLGSRLCCLAASATGTTLPLDLCRHL